jgi:hypothetical protein
MMCPKYQAGSELDRARCLEARMPTVDEMRKDLEEAGWVQEYANVWKDKRGCYFRGPAKAWHMMMKKPWPPNGELSRGGEQRKAKYAEEKQTTDQ